jgi:hypothetical protein
MSWGSLPRNPKIDAESAGLLYGVRLIWDSEGLPCPRIDMLGSAPPKWVDGSLPTIDTKAGWCGRELIAASPA